jgi:hypothetical protein
MDTSPDDVFLDLEGDVDPDPTPAETLALVEIDAAIALVSGHAARRVRLTAMPALASVAGLGLARAQDAGLPFQYEQDGGVVTITIGPIE